MLIKSEFITYYMPFTVLDVFTYNTSFITHNKLEKQIFFSFFSRKGKVICLSSLLGECDFLPGYDSLFSCFFFLILCYPIITIQSSDYLFLIPLDIVLQYYFPTHTKSAHVFTLRVSLIIVPL